jgi:hypothetical protein
MREKEKKGAFWSIWSYIKKDVYKKKGKRKGNREDPFGTDGMAYVRWNYTLSQASKGKR